MAANDRKRPLKVRTDGFLITGDLKVESPSVGAKRQKKTSPKSELFDGAVSSPKPRLGELKPKANGGAAAPRKRANGLGDAVDGIEDTGSTALNANHNKYCHFCQHVKVRASSMLACANQECCRRFCEHCLITHLGEDVNPQTSSSFEVLNGSSVWYCPICRDNCCCSVGECKQDHRHCKAYRYRRRRAELASKRMSTSSEGRRVKKSSNKTKAVRPVAVATKSSDTESAADTPPAWGGSTGSAASNSWDLQDPNGDGEEEPTRCDSSGLSDSGEEEQDNFASGLWGEEGASTTSARGQAHQKARSYEEPREHPAEGDFAVDDGVHSGEKVEDAEGFDDGFDGDAFGNMYGHMFSIPAEYESNLGDDFADKLVGLSNSAEVDEAQWLRRTYETVYNPAARQRALNNLVSGTGMAVKKAPARSTELFEDYKHFNPPAVPARKATVMYDFV